MIRVTVELLPCSEDETKHLLGVGIISNTGTGTLTSGNYTSRFYDASGVRIVYKGSLEDFPRLEKDVWQLLAQTLINAVAGKT